MLQIQSYLDDAENMKPFIITGPSGSGKTRLKFMRNTYELSKLYSCHHSLMATLAKKVSQVIVYYVIYKNQI